MFKCTKCGLCCQNLNMSKYYDDLHDGNGVCKYFDKKNNLCSIYFRRPIKCNVDLMYEKYFKKVMTKKEFYKYNYKICKLLKER